MIGAIVAGGLSAPAPLVTNSYESISTVTVGSGGASSVTFSSIPSTYKHLQIRMIGRSSYTGGSGADNFNLQLNGDTTSSNYYRHTLRGSGSGVDTPTGNDNLFVSAILTNNGNTNMFGALVIDILDYTNTNKNTTIRSLGGYDANGSGYLQLESMLWNNTAAINQIVLGTGGWAQYSSFALYGIKG